MRIGIITQPLVNNYGGLLQNYALQETLRRMGHNPVTIDQPMFPPVPVAKEAFALAKARVASAFGALRGRPAVESKYEVRRRLAKRLPYASGIAGAHISSTEKIYGRRAMAQATRETGVEGLVIGSDQVWRKGMNPRMEACFGDFAADLGIGVMSYAASFGVDEWQFDAAETELYARLIKRFAAVSVREASGVRLCREHLGVDAELVLDPTMLLNRSDYARLAGSGGAHGGPGRLFAYILDACEGKSRFIGRQARERGLAVGEASPGGSGITVEEWVRNFAEADFVVCDSFHGAVFSIIFNKDFLVISNSARGNTRFDSLLSMFGLGGRLFDESRLGEAPIPGAVDWNRVNGELELRREASLAFLRGGLARLNNSQNR